MAENVQSQETNTQKTSQSETLSTQEKSAGETSKTVIKELTLNLRRYILVASRFKRAKKAIKALRHLALRHSKAKEVKISARLNQYIWSRGIKKPPSKVTVKIIKKEDTAYVDLAS